MDYSSDSYTIRYGGFSICSPSPRPLSPRSQPVSPDRRAPVSIRLSRVSHTNQPGGGAVGHHDPCAPRRACHEPGRTSTLAQPIGVHDPHTHAPSQSRDGCDMRQGPEPDGSRASVVGTVSPVEGRRYFTSDRGLRTRGRDGSAVLLACQQQTSGRFSGTAHHARF